MAESGSSRFIQGSPLTQPDFLTSGSPPLSHPPVCPLCPLKHRSGFVIPLFTPQWLPLALKVKVILFGPVCGDPGMAGF